VEDSSVVLQARKGWFVGLQVSPSHPGMRWGISLTVGRTGHGVYPDAKSGCIWTVDVAAHDGGCLEGMCGMFFGTSFWGFGLGHVILGGLFVLFLLAKCILYSSLDQPFCFVFYMVPLRHGINAVTWPKPAVEPYSLLRGKLEFFTLPTAGRQDAVVFDGMVERAGATS
jgi:hypothetical protein